MFNRILGEMHFIRSQADSWFNLPRGSGVSYAAQESWVQSATIRENILFGTRYDEERYKKGNFFLPLRTNNNEVEKYFTNVLWNTTLSYLTQAITQKSGKEA